MGHEKNYYIETSHFQESFGHSPVRILDGGARGELFSPFSDIKSKLHVYAFEPDSDAEKRNSRPGLKTEFIDVALWKEKTELELHLAANPSTSSVYPPNMSLLKSFPDHIGAPTRKTVDVVNIPAISIDEAVADGVIDEPHFIKLDVHSAEYEALIGAKRTLNRTTVGVLVETWHSPIHSGQTLHGAVEHFLNENGFYLFHLRKNSQWPHLDEGEASRVNRLRHVASESLFLRDVSEADPVDRSQAIILIAIADLFQYSNYAIHLAQTFAQRGVFSEKMKHDVVRLLRRFRKIRERDTRARHFMKRMFFSFLERMRPAFKGAEEMMNALMKYFLS